MTFLSLLVFVGLSSCALVASLAVAVRLRYESKAETLLAVLLLANASILVPIHVLGLLSALTPWALALSSLFVSALTCALTTIGTDRRDHVRRVVAVGLDLVQLPAQALRLCWEARSFVGLGLLASFASIVWTVWLSYLAPSDSWDGTWYHEAMVGYAIQLRGYAPIPLPSDFIQQANGYPRNCEMTNLWFVIFTGRSLIEAVNSFAAMPLMLATYVIARRCNPDRIGALGWAAAILIMPGSLLELRSTYMDLHVGAFLVAAVSFSIRSPMRLRDGWMASLSLALLIGAKSLALAWVPPLAVLALTQLLWQGGRSRLRDVVLVAAGGGFLIALMASMTYLRNWKLYHNPFWPVTVNSERFHIHFAGLGDLSTINYRRDLGEIWSDISGVPVPGKDFADTRVYGYGLAVPFLLLPLGAVAFACNGMATFKYLARRLTGTDDGEAATRAYRVFVLSVFFLFTAALSPQLWQARYNIQLGVALMILVHWLSGARGRGRLASEAASAAILCFAINQFWATPGWGLGLPATVDYSRLPRDERAARTLMDWSISPEVARARDRELGPGSVVAYTNDITFLGVLWNENYSNRLVYVPTAPTAAEWLQRLDAANALWAVAGAGTPLYQALQSKPEGWEAIGLASRGFPTTAFHRKPR